MTHRGAVYRFRATSSPRRGGHVAAFQAPDRCRSRNDRATRRASAWTRGWKRSRHSGEAFCPFDLAADYRFYVDGKPRFDGVRDFLSSRGISLPEGNPEDPADVETVCGLGNRKNDLVNHVICLLYTSDAADEL